jgi:hypothetical protein
MQIHLTPGRVAVGAAALILSGVGLATLLSPLVGSALATAGQVVNVSDPTAPNTAKVDASGRLSVGDGGGPLSVDGTVTSRAAAPASPWSASSDIANGGKYIAGPTTGSINITSLSLSTDAPVGDGVPVVLWGKQVPSSATTCNNALTAATLWVLRDLGDGVTPLSFSFPTPLSWKAPANTKACLFASAGTAVATTINAVGFYGG